MADDADHQNSAWIDEHVLCIALFVQSGNPSSQNRIFCFYPFLISKDSKFVSTASSEREKATPSSSRGFSVGVFRHNKKKNVSKEGALRSQTTENKWKGRSINIICINGVCAEVIYFPFPSYPLCIVCFIPCGMAAVLALLMDQHLGTRCHSPQQPSSRPLSSSFEPRFPSNQSGTSKSRL
jgi:hypothetical protein